MKISLYQVRDTARDVADRHPYKLNPMVGNVCVYTNPDDASDHCFAGQILVDLGVPLPGYNGSVTSVPELAELLTQGAIAFLAQCQYEADLGNATPEKVNNLVRRKPWREAYEGACRAVGRLP